MTVRTGRTPRPGGRAPAPPTPAGQRLHVDWTRCDGHGLCAELLPGRVVMDEWGFPVIRKASVSAGETTDVRRAVTLCPALALRLADR